MMLPYSTLAAACCQWGQHQLICRELEYGAAKALPGKQKIRNQSSLRITVLPSLVQSENKPWNITEHGSYHPIPYLGHLCIWDKGAGLSREVPTQSFL